MLKYIFTLVPQIGTSFGSLLGITSKKKQEDDLVAIATGILGAILFNLFFEALVNIRSSLFIGMTIGILFILFMNLITKNHSKLVLAMIIHNIPEGMIVGIALANTLTIVQVISIVVSITIQNIPDGLVISMALLPKYGKIKSVILGIVSGIIEPIVAILIIIFTQGINISIIEPFFIGFSLATIFVIELDLIKSCKKTRLFIISLLIAISFNWILG